MRRLASLAVEGDPDFVRQLGTDVMEEERRQQAHDGVRDGRGYHRNRFEFRGFNLGESIETVPQILDESLRDQTLKPALGNPERREVSRSEKGAEARFLQLNCI